jgi:hypothetical protein
MPKKTKAKAKGKKKFVEIKILKAKHLPAMDSNKLSVTIIHFVIHLATHCIADSVSEDSADELLRQMLLKRVNPRS